MKKIVKISLLLIIEFSIFFCYFKIQKNDTNAELELLLGSMGYEDQAVRHAFLEEEKNGKDSIKLKNLSKSRHITDSVNQCKFDSLCTLYGKETVFKIGRSKAFYIVQHGNFAYQLKYVNVLKQLNKEGYIESYLICMLEDRMLLRNKKKQIYGTQLCKDKETGQWFVCPLEEPEKVQIRRYAMGFKNSFKERLKEEDIEWNPEEYKKQLPRYIEIEKKKGVY